MKKKGLFASLSFLSLLLMPSFGNASWSIPVESNLDIESTSDRAICYNSSTNAIYSSLKRALLDATSGQEVVMYIGAKATCEEDIEIKKGVTLTIPFLGKAYDSSKTGANISTNSTLYKIPDADNRGDYGNTLGDNEKNTKKTFRSILVEMKKGADIINNGTLRVGGACSTFGNNGYYSEITLGKDSSIICNSGSIFDCYGYVKEDASDYVNQFTDGREIFDNSIDSGRMIHLNSGSTLTTSLAMYDARTAGDLTRLLSAGQTPFWEWDIPSLQTYTKIDFGSNFIANALLVGPSNMAISKDVSLFCNDTSKESMFYLTSGYVGLEYLTNNPEYSSREFNARKTNFFLNGTTSVGYIYAKEGVGSNSVELDTRKTFLPVSNRTRIIIGPGQTFTTDKKMKFLSDTFLLIQKGGTFNVNNQVIFYKRESLYFNEGASVYYRATEKMKLTDARLICNGNLVINSDSSGNGTIGAFVEHESTDGSASFDITKISDLSKLSVKDSEGAGSITVAITSSGIFSDGEAAFSPGNKYTSVYNGTFYWNGPSISTHNIDVAIVGETTTSIVLYTIQYADDANGTNSVDTDLTDAKVGGTISVPKGKYARLILKRGESASVKDSSGNEIVSDYASYFLVDKNIVIEITPSETFSIDFTLVSESGNTQGSGHFVLEIWECKTSNGTFEMTSSSKYNANGKKVTKGYYFYLKRPFDGNWIMNIAYNRFKNENATITKNPDIGEKPDWNVYKKESSPVYFADANYTFDTKFK